VRTAFSFLDEPGAFLFLFFLKNKSLRHETQESIAPAKALYRPYRQGFDFQAIGSSESLKLLATRARRLRRYVTRWTLKVQGSRFKSSRSLVGGRGSFVPLTLNLTTLNLEQVSPGVRLQTIADQRLTIAAEVRQPPVSDRRLPSVLLDCNSWLIRTAAALYRHALLINNFINNPR
jgi:hypothetical protein